MPQHTQPTVLPLGNDLASEFLRRTSRARDIFAASIESANTTWHTLASLFRPLPIPEQIGSLDALNRNL
jgi:hypothetical protein